MARIANELGAHRVAVDELIRAATSCGENWDVPAAPGKWSPAQIVEHVARALEEGAKDLSGESSRLPKLPRPVRFLARQLHFRRVVRTGRFPRSKTNAEMDPEAGPPTPDAARERLERAWEAYERSATALSVSGDTATSGIFGTVTLADAVRFSELHTRHHTAQMPIP